MRTAMEPEQETMAREETASLIASDKVEGTDVYNPAGEHLGAVHNLMIDKRSGQVRYAVMSFGGFLGIGRSYHPLPWQALNYDTRLDGYVVDVDKDRLRDAPHYADGEAPAWTDPAYGRRIDDYYRL